MSTTPPEQPTTPSGGGYGGEPRPNVNFNVAALMPTPGNAEMVVYILATIVIGIIALASDDYGGGSFAGGFTLITAAYLISRGVAKASRVLER
jgi:hypothetical protein